MADGENSVLWTFFFVLVVLWIFGFKNSFAMGGFIHVLLLLAIGTGLIRILQGRRPV